MSLRNQDPLFDGVAIIGMAGRFPGAGTVAAFWRNQLRGVEAISRFGVEDLEVSNSGVALTDPNYVRARSVLDGIDSFDAGFFGIYPREAELMDPQQRLFLETCWHSFEDAGYDPFTFPGSIGVYAGSSPSTYFLSRLCTRPGFLEEFTNGYQVGNYPEMVGNSLDFLATRVSYILNLRGPSFTILSACSTSLVAVTQACQSLLTYQCDMALAGGVSITLPQRRGTHYQEGGMVSPDGHCRAFDADASGTVFGSGVAVVLLKRLEDAMQDGDQIYSVIRGFGVNNDGATKVGYTAPSVEGQSRAIALAQAAAGVEPDTIGYVEAHGTGTPLGDPIELAALTKAFGARTSKNNYCVIGTAKTNVGHLDAAAGVTGLINATHIVRHGVFPPTLHFNKPNANFDLKNSPFFVNTTLAQWKPNGVPRRAGVSSFGVGGTNAHVVIEQAPDQQSTISPKPAHLLVLSARTEAALDQATDNLVAHLGAHPDTNLADAAWTLQVGRHEFGCRHTVVARNVTEAITALSQRVQDRARNRPQPKERSVNFLFPGQGSQHANMGREIYQTEPVFRDTVDRCVNILRPHLGVDLRSLLYQDDDATDNAKRRVTDTIFAQPALFTIEYALAQLWMAWGIRPKAMLGHSIGEFVAACLAGVFSLEDALAVIAARGRMMQQLPAGGMLSVRMPESELRRRLPGSLSIAAVNSPSLCVAAGPSEAIAEFEQDLAREGIAVRRLVTSHAFHSAMMDPLIEPFTAVVAKVCLNSPQIPYVSGVTGTWITDREATDPSYWARHARKPVQFSAAIAELLKDPDAALVEVGPGNVLTTLARQHVGASANQTVVSSLSDNMSGDDDATCLMSAVGSLWRVGVQPDWRALHGEERRQRISLPTYPFEGKRYWLELDTVAQLSAAAANSRSSSNAGEPAKVQEPDPMNIMTNVSGAAPSGHTGREARIHAALVEIFEDLSGMDFATVDRSTTFLELGFDSLFLTQVTQALQGKFGAKITFRQLLGDQSTLDALAQYLDGQLAPDLFAEPVLASVAVPAPVPAPAPLPIEVHGAASVLDPAVASSPIDRLVREQLHAMNALFAKQLDVIRGPATALVVQPPTSVPSRALPDSATHPAATSTVPPSTVAVSPAGAKEQSRPHGPFRPVQKDASGKLSGPQQEQLTAFIERHTKRTAKSKRMTQHSRKMLADPRAVSGFRTQWKELVYPIVTHRSQGSRLWDVDGNEYIDLLNGFGSIMLGHRPELVERAIEKQLREGIEIGPQTPLAGEVAKMFCEMTGNERMTFCNTGSEAVMAAMRVARTVTGRSKVVMFSGDYHGTFDEVLVKGFTNKAGAAQSAPIAPGIPRENLSNVIVLDYGAPASLSWIRANATDLAAVLVEPVQSRHPDLQPVEFLKELRAITQQSGAALIFDEIVTGFRVHQGGCQALFDIRADLATYGKVVAGGMPIGILAGKAQFMDAIDGGMWQYGDDSFPEVGVTFFAGTFVRHPLTLAAARAVLEHLRDEGPALQQRLTERAARLAYALSDIAARRNIPAKIERFGSLFYLGFAADERFASLFYYYMRDKGVHLREGFPCFLTTAHSDSDLETIADAFEKSAVEMQQAGFLSGPATELLKPAAEAPSIVSESTGLTEVPMTEAQREIFLAAMLGDDASCSFNESFSVHLRGTLQIDALREALDALLARHEALRAVIDPGGATLHFRPELKLEIPLRDLSTFEASARDVELNRVLAEDAHKAFDLTNGPLVRAQLVRLATDYHVLIFTSHHIVCDGWSTNVLLDELAQTYSGKVKRHPVELPPVVRFSDYAHSPTHANNANTVDKVEAYWLTQFKDIPPPLELPLDRRRASVKSYSGATLRTLIDAEAYRKIKQLGSKNGCTLFVTLLAGFQTLLHRLSAQDDIVVGIPAAGQSLVEGGSLVGHCVNFLPIRARFLQGQTFAELLTTVKKTLLDAYDHQSYTYGTLVRKLAITRDPSRLPLMEVQFNLERIGRGADFAGLNVSVDPNAKGAVNFDLFVNVVESDQGLTIHCDYNTDLFNQATIARWLEAFRLLLLAGLSDPEQAVAALPVLTSTKSDGGRAESLSSEEHALLARWNETRTDYPRDRSIVAVFEDQVAQTPDAIAVVIGDQQLSYRELNERANRLAHYLQRLGVANEDMVACCLERSVELIVAILGILKAGAAYAPLDPTVPKARLEYMLADTRAPVMLTQKKLIDAGLSKLAISMIALDEANSPDRLEISENLNDVPAPDHLAYVIYTSGSTGRPKGVMTEHRNVVRLVKDTNYCAFGSSEVFLQFAPISFDASTFEIWGALLNGGRLVIMPPGLPSLEDLGRVIREHGVTTLWLTAGLFHVMVEQRLDDLRPLHQLLAGGDVLSPWHVRQVLEKLPSLRLINGYGPTENTTFTCCHAFAGAEEVPDPVPIGRPISNTRVYVLDSALRAVPIGAAGELFIAGDGLARGYLNAPELTEAKFITHVTADGVTERLYRTGDQARFLQDGAVQFLGRTDNQIKLRGYRIELEEIEAVLRRHPSVRQACVVAEREGVSVRRLLAYCVPAANAGLSESVLREHLQSALPQYMVPETFVALDSLPLTPIGKIDREKLPSLDAAKPGPAREYVAPSTPREKLLADIVAGVLRVERIGVTDNLFERGADSLQVFQIASRAAKAGVPVTPRLVLTHRTISAVLGELETTRSAAHKSAPSLKPVQRQKYRAKLENL